MKSYMYMILIPIMMVLLAGVYMMFATVSSTKDHVKTNTSVNTVSASR